MQVIEFLSAALGLLGTVLLATRSPCAGWGFVAYLVSNIGWLVFSFNLGHIGLFWQQIGFLAMSVWGIWTWLIRPALQRRSAMQHQQAGGCP